MSTEKAPHLFSNRFAGMAGDVEQPVAELCRCLGAEMDCQSVWFHPERQDTSASGWLRLLELIEEAAADGREEFAPLTEMSAEQRRQVVTLPASIGTLTEVRKLVLYRSNLVRIPAEIGGMRSLEVFEPYTSYRLHWFPYELSRLPALRGSTVSTRALYGNESYRPGFPALAEPVGGRELGALDPGVWGATEVRACSVCDGPVAELRQAWISLHTSGADVLPLLVNACSDACLASLPSPPEDYVPTWHRGGPDLVQPPVW
ncbi:leucine-rich repeat domain-containing protein [Kitasatospora griseola]|uniref:leucine-rich repeat domain-containing protein n=1 Tax=Kitasatospora griseola TaxID=2064 RepID=UPI00382E43D1